MSAIPPLNDDSMARLASTEVLFMLYGFIPILRDLAQAVFDAAEKGEAVDSAEITGWVIRLDFLGNHLSTAYDECVDVFQKYNLPAPLCWGSTVQRPGR